MAKGASSLSDAELIAILIGSGNRNETAVELSRRILTSVNSNLIVLGNLRLHELSAFPGMGEAKSLTIMAAMELGRRRKAAEARQIADANNSRALFDVLHQHMDGLRHEEFWMVALNRKLRVIAERKVSEGGLTATHVDVKKIFRYAIELNSAFIIVAHNHPSGNLYPSREDDLMTKRIMEAGKLLDCPLCDHLIITDTGYYSYADKGRFDEI